MFNGFTRTRIDANGTSIHLVHGGQVQVMARLGFDSFHVVGHDRGARVGHRMALDHPDRVRTLTSLDVVPSQAAFDNMDKDLSFTRFH